MTTGRFRRPMKFESADGYISYTFPPYALEYEASQPLENASVALTGASYDYDQLESGLAPKRNGTHTLRFLLVGAFSDIEIELDEMKANLYLAGKGKFYLQDSDGATRWCWARVIAMPEIRLGVSNKNTLPVIVSFSQFSDFYGDSLDYI